MNRRSFFEMVCGFFGFTVIANSAQDAAETTEHEVPVTGPYCVEVYSPFKLRDRTLPLFDNMRHAQNFAITRQDSLRRDGCTSGKILVILPDGTVCQNITWGSGWSQTVTYTKYSDDKYWHSKNV